MSSPFEGYSRRHSDLSDPLVHYDRYSSGEHPPRGDVGYGGTYGAAGGAPSEDHNSTEGWHRIEPVARDDSHGGGGPYAPLYDDGRKTKVSCWSLAPNFIGRCRLRGYDMMLYQCVLQLLFFFSASAQWSCR